MKRLLLMYLLLLTVFSSFGAVGQETPYRVPDPDHQGHFKRPDGKNCKKTGDHPCACAVTCSRDAEGKPVVHMGAQCQTWCKETACDCHPCAEGECSDGQQH